MPLPGEVIRANKAAEARLDVSLVGFWRPKDRMFVDVRILNTIPLSKEDQDSMTTTYNLDPKFVVDIPTKEDYKEVEPINYNINCHTDGSKLDDNRAGAGVLINYSHIDNAEEAIHLGNSATVFQAEVFAVGRTASHLIFAETNNKSVVINCDSQAAIMALDIRQH